MFTKGRQAARAPRPPPPRPRPRPRPSLGHGRRCGRGRHAGGAGAESGRGWEEGKPEEIAEERGGPGRRERVGGGGGRRQCLRPGASVFPSVKWAWAFGRTRRPARPPTLACSERGSVAGQGAEGPDPGGGRTRWGRREARAQVTGFLGEPGRIGRSYPSGSQGPPQPSTAGRSPLVPADAPRVAADPSASGVRCPGGPARDRPGARGLGDSAWGSHRPCSIGGGRGTRRLRAVPVRAARLGRGESTERANSCIDARPGLRPELGAGVPSANPAPRSSFTRT